MSTHTLLFFAPGRGGTDRRRVAAVAARDPGGVPLRLGVHARLQRPGPAGHRPPHLLAPALRAGGRALPVLDRHLLPGRPPPSEHGTPRADTIHLLYLFGTGYYQLYYLLVLLEFYALFPLLLVLLRKTAGHHGLVLLVSGLVQLALVSSMHWGLVPAWMQGYWATREVTSYQFYLVAGMVVAMHLDEFHDWLCAHVLAHRGGHAGGGRRGRGLVLPGGRPRGVVARLERRSLPADRDPVQHRGHRLHLPDRRGAGASAAIEEDPGRGAVGLGQLLRDLPGPGAPHHDLELARLAAPQPLPALAAGRGHHGGGRLRVLYRPDRVAGPHAVGQAPDRPHPGPVDPRGRGDGGLARAPTGSTGSTPIRYRRQRCRVRRTPPRRWRRRWRGSPHRRGGGCARAAVRCT